MLKKSCVIQCNITLIPLGQYYTGQSPKLVPQNLKNNFFQDKFYSLKAHAYYFTVLIYFATWRVNKLGIFTHFTSTNLSWCSQSINSLIYVYYAYPQLLFMSPPLITFFAVLLRPPPYIFLLCISCLCISYIHILCKYIYIYIYIHIFIKVVIYISSLKLSTTRKVLKSYKSKMSIIYIYIYICNHESIVPSWLAPQWLCGNCALGHMR